MKLLFAVLAFAVAGCYKPAVPSAPSAPSSPAAAGIAAETPDPQGKFCDLTAVTDGDSVKVRLDGEVIAVRLEGIDAPDRAREGGKARNPTGI